MEKQGRYGLLEIGTLVTCVLHSPSNSPPIFPYLFPFTPQTPRLPPILIPLSYPVSSSYTQTFHLLPIQSGSDSTCPSPLFSWSPFHPPYLSSSNMVVSLFPLNTLIAGSTLIFVLTSSHLVPSDFILFVSSSTFLFCL